MGNDSGYDDHQRQMQSFMPALDQFNAAASTNLRPTPYMALQLKEQMLESIEREVRALYGASQGSTLIPTCMYGDSLEPIHCDDQRVRAIAAIDNHRGLQILLFSVGGRTLRKDGVPFHSILSSEARDAGIERPVRDDTYYWPVKDMEAKRVFDHKGQPHIELQIHERKVRYQRVLTDVEIEAEALAKEAHTYLQNNASFTSDTFDFLRIDIPMDIPPLEHDEDDEVNTWINPLPCIVENIEGEKHVTLASSNNSTGFAFNY